MDLKTHGGKAKNLFDLQNFKINVPPFFVIDTTFFDVFFKDIKPAINTLIKKTNLNEVNDIQILSEQIQQIILKKEFDISLLNFLNDQGYDFENEYFSIRSSAIDEDGDNHSFAGLMDSYLYIKGKDAVIEHIKKCFASTYTDRALSYRHFHKLDLFDIKLAVIVQKMIFGTVSGILFTGNPLNNNPDEMVISANYGIGEGIVSGVLNCDSWVLDNSGKIVESKIVTKEEMISFNKKTGFGTRSEEVFIDKRGLSSLSLNQIDELYKIGKIIEEFKQSIPQDIEWTILDNSLYILQTRPITTMSKINKKEPKTIWDNSNIVESYSGVTTPLTFSFANSAYEQVYKQFYSMMGTSDKKISTMNSTFANMLGFIHGRVYYNLTNWYSTLKLLPGYAFNKDFMEGMMGVKDKTKEPEATTPLSFKDKYLVALPELLIGVYSIITQFINLNKSILIFFKNLNESLEHAGRIHFSKLNDYELITVYKFLQTKLLSNWKTPIVNDFFTMIFYGVLKKLVVSWELDIKGNLQNDLLCGEGDIESTKPTKLLIEISNFIRTDLKIKSYILNSSDDEIYSELFTKETPEFLLPFKTKITSYLDLYGFRCINELKLEEDSLKDNPRFIFGILRGYLKKDEINLAEMEAKEKQTRRTAEKLVEERLQNQKILYVINKKIIFDFVLNNARLMVKNRENLRFGRTRVFGTVREIMNALGHNLVRNGKLNHFKDIYFLTVDEIISFCDGRAITQNLKELAAIRKKEYEEHQTMEPPERFFTYGTFYTSVKIVPKLPDPLKDLNLAPHFLKGVACSPGLLQEKCKIILSPKDEINLNGEILVTARTDPGWVPIFPSIKGLLIEKGSILSHSAVVAREMGIPTIVGLTDVTKKIKNDQVVVMDGSKGLVNLNADLDETIETLV